MHKINKKKAGFTLIELLVVVAIIALLSSIVLSGLRESREKAAVARIKEIGEQIKIALELYKSDHGEYPVYNTFSIDPWNRTSNTGTISAYIKDISITNDNLTSFWFRDPSIYNVLSVYYVRNVSIDHHNFTSCTNIPDGVFVPYTVTFVIDPYEYDLTSKYGFHRYKDVDNETVYNNIYCLFTPPY